MIEKEEFKNDHNLLQCECGSWGHYMQMKSSEDGTYTCPSCQIGWMHQVISMYKSIIDQTSQDDLSLNLTNALIRKKLAELLHIDTKDLEYEFTDWYLIKP